MQQHGKRQQHGKHLGLDEKRLADPEQPEQEIAEAEPPADRGRGTRKLPSSATAAEAARSVDEPDQHRQREPQDGPERRTAPGPAPRRRRRRRRQRAGAIRDSLCHRAGQARDEFDEARACGARRGARTLRDAAAGSRLVTARRAGVSDTPRQMNPQLLDAARIGIEHLELEPAGMADSSPRAGTRPTSANTRPPSVSMSSSSSGFSSLMPRCSSSSLDRRARGGDQAELGVAR